MQRLPQNQRLTTDFPILHFGRVPEFDLGTWDLRVEGLVENPVRLTYDEFLTLEKTADVSDFHCVTGWSIFDNKWEGVRFRDIAEGVQQQRRSVERGEVFVLIELPLLPKIEFENNQPIYEIQNRR